MKCSSYTMIRTLQKWTGLKWDGASVWIWQLGSHPRKNLLPWVFFFCLICCSSQTKRIKKKGNDDSKIREKDLVWKIWFPSPFSSKNVLCNIQLVGDSSSVWFCWMAKVGWQQVIMVGMAHTNLVIKYDVVLFFIRVSSNSRWFWHRFLKQVEV